MSIVSELGMKLRSVVLRPLAFAACRTLTVDNERVPHIGLCVGDICNHSGPQGFDHAVVVQVTQAVGMIEVILGCPFPLATREDQRVPLHVGGVRGGVEVMEVLDDFPGCGGVGSFGIRSENQRWAISGLDYRGL